jgi:hypothetical protein
MIVVALANAAEGAELLSSEQYEALLAQATH